MIINQLYTDWSLYQEVLLHLLTNAIKFSSPNATLQIQLTVFKSQDYEKNKIKPNALSLETKIVNLGPKFELKKK